MRRRDFTALASTLGGAALATPALVQAQALVEGQQYRRLGQALAQPAGKIEVVEFFLYTCPHCYIFDPVLREWLKHLPSDVVFRRVHVGYKPHARLFLTLEALGQLGNLHEKVFDAFQRQRIIPESDEAAADLAAKLGLDRAKFVQAQKSFSVEGKLAQNTKLAEAYGIQTVPALGVGGRFVTAPSMAGGATEQESGGRALVVVDQLIQRLRSGKA
ncbi:MAG TPA: thiol:disulfide interchange protein DsbA/DsbL [Burkholderiaceae bacterium]